MTHITDPNRGPGYYSRAHRDEQWIADELARVERMDHLARYANLRDGGNLPPARDGDWWGVVGVIVVVSMSLLVWVSIIQSVRLWWGMW
jgi:hypothetical protein